MLVNKYPSVICKYIVDELTVDLEREEYIHISYMCKVIRSILPSSLFSHFHCASS
jgi:hypothetical protein